MSYDENRISDQIDGGLIEKENLEQTTIMSNEEKIITAAQANELARGPRKNETIEQVLERIRYAACLGGGEIELYYYNSQIVDVLKDLGYYVDVEPHCITVHWGGAV